MKFNSVAFLSFLKFCGKIGIDSAEGAAAAGGCACGGVRPADVDACAIGLAAATDAC